jgi:hypothetical protein
METILLSFIIAFLIIYAILTLWQMTIVCEPPPENGKSHSKIELEINWRLNRPPILYHGFLPLLVEGSIIFYWIASILGVILVYLKTSSVLFAFLAACFFFVGTFVSIKILKSIALIWTRKYWRN